MPCKSEGFSRQLYSKVCIWFSSHKHFSMFLYLSDWHCPSTTCWSCWGPRDRQGCWQRNPSWRSHASGSCRTCWASPWGWWAISAGELRKGTSIWWLKNRGRVHSLRKVQNDILWLSGVFHSALNMVPELNVIVNFIDVVKEMHERYIS